MARTNTPDIVLMDLIMPNMDGVQATKKITQTTPCAILLTTSSINTNSEKIYEAMGYGALDVVLIPSLDDKGKLKNNPPLVQKIIQIAAILDDKSVSLHKPISLKSIKKPHTIPIIAIGASTGGPNVIAQILSQLPSDFPAAILIVQHVSQTFATGFVSWLKQQTALAIEVATPNIIPKPGHVYVAPTDKHLIVTSHFSHFTLDHSANPSDLVHRPSIDVLFKSLTPCPQPQYYQHTAILLSGMGQDGAEGLLRLKNANWSTIAQNEHSAVVPAMPKAAIALNAASKILSIEQIYIELETTYSRQSNSKIHQIVNS